MNASKKETKRLRQQINLAELYEKVPNRFLLSIAAAKRARQIINGAAPLIEANLSNNKALDIALMEIQLGKINVSVEGPSDEESIIEEISDYLDADILDDPKQPESPQSKAKKDLKKRRRSASA